MLALAISLIMILQAGQDPATTDGDPTAWRDHIAPTDTETRWQAIDWSDSISAGLRAASQTNRPMLLWLMNGHPLGCT